MKSLILVDILQNSNFKFNFFEYFRVKGFWGFGVLFLKILEFFYNNN